MLFEKLYDWLDDKRKLLSFNYIVLTGYECLCMYIYETDGGSWAREGGGFPFLLFIMMTTILILKSFLFAIPLILIEKLFKIRLKFKLMDNLLIIIIQTIGFTTWLFFLAWSLFLLYLDSYLYVNNLDNAVSIVIIKYILFLLSLTIAILLYFNYRRKNRS